MSDMLMVGSAALMVWSFIKLIQMNFQGDTNGMILCGVALILNFILFMSRVGLMLT